MSQVRLSLAATCVLLLLSNGGSAAELTAEEMIAAAHEGRATWDGIHGFTAKVRVTSGSEVAEGSVTVSAAGELEIAGLDSKPEANRILHSMIGHRFASDFKPSDPRFVDQDTTHPLGRLIEFGDGPHPGKFRIQGDVIREVHRSSERGSFVITVMDVYRNEAGKHLPQNYTVSRWDAAGNLVGATTVHDEWLVVDGWDLPKSRTSVTTSDKHDQPGIDVTKIDFFDHQVLAKSAE